MKTTDQAKKWAAVFAAALTATAAFQASADQDRASTAVRSEREYTGTVIFADPNERMLQVRHWPMFSRTFNLGDNCTFALVDKNNGMASDLRPGQKVIVNYQDAHGVRIADRVRQQPMRFEGMITAIDLNRHALTLRRHGMNQEVQIADGCRIVLHDNKAGALADLHPGNHVTVTYESPAGKPTARMIAQTSMEFVGKLTAIDLGEKTVKARALVGSKKFNLADNCVIVVNGRTDGRLSDLRPEERLAFSYDDINGVSVVNRIGPETRPNSPSETASVPTIPPSAYMGY